MEKIKDTFVQKVEFSILVRIFHWIRAIAVLVLVGTGFYIAYPFIIPNVSTEPTSFLYALMRSWHLMFGFALMAVTIFKIYLFIFDKKSSGERISFFDFISFNVWKEQILTYIMMRKHPHLKGFYNPLQFIAYFALFVMLTVEILTGIILYYNIYHQGLGAVLAVMFKWFEVMCGGLANVRSIHHILTWGFILFALTHIYMVIWNAVRHPDGGVDSIVSGIRYAKKK